MGFENFNQSPKPKTEEKTLDKSQDKWFQVILGKESEDIREEDKMKFNQNNGILAFVDEKGHLYASPATNEKRQELQNFGFKEGGLFVPFSNGDLPSDPEGLKRWEKLKNKKS